MHSFSSSSFFLLFLFWLYWNIFFILIHLKITKSKRTTFFRKCILYFVYEIQHLEIEKKTLMSSRVWNNILCTAQCYAHSIKDTFWFSLLFFTCIRLLILHHCFCFGFIEITLILITLKIIKSNVLVSSENNDVYFTFRLWNSASENRKKKTFNNFKIYFIEQYIIRRKLIHD